MKPARLLWRGLLLALIAVAVSGCVEGGIGMGLPASGARWGGGSGPDVLVGGGPVYR